MSNVHLWDLGGLAWKAELSWHAAMMWLFFFVILEHFLYTKPFDGLPSVSRCTKLMQEHKVHPEQLGEGVSLQMA